MEPGVHALSHQEEASPETRGETQVVHQVGGAPGLLKQRSSSSHELTAEVRLESAEGFPFSREPRRSVAAEAKEELAAECALSSLGVGEECEVLENGVGECRFVTEAPAVECDQSRKGEGRVGEVLPVVLVDCLLPDCSPWCSKLCTPRGSLAARRSSRSSCSPRSSPSESKDS